MKSARINGSLAGIHTGMQLSGRSEWPNVNAIGIPANRA